MAVEKEQLGMVADTDWVRHVFYLPRRDETEEIGEPNVFWRDVISDTSATRSYANRKGIVRGRQFTAGVLNYSDTSFGGNMMINPLPQFTATADLDVDQVVAGGLGMGRYYFESIDAYQQRIYMQFGVVELNGALNFWRLFYDYGQSKLANRGIVHKLLYSWAKIAGYVVFWKATLLLGFANMVYKAYRSASRAPYTKYAYMRPTMPLFWSKASSIFNAISVNMGLSQGFVDDELKRQISHGGTDATGYAFDKIDGGGEYTEREIDDMNKLVSTVFRSASGGIDLRTSISRHQRLSNEHNEKIRQILEDAATAEDARQRMAAYFKEQSAMAEAREKLDSTKKGLTPAQYMDQYEQTKFAKTDQGVAISEEDEIEQINAGVIGGKGTIDSHSAPNALEAANLSWDTQDVARQGQESFQNKSLLSKMYKGLVETFADSSKFFKAEMDDGSAFVCLGVDYQGESSESFSNSTSPTDVQGQVNSMASASKRLMYNLSGGKIDGGIIDGVTGTVAGWFESVVMGAASAVGLEGVAALGGNAFVDIPEFWEQSTTAFDSTTYTIPLRTWSGHPMIIQKRILPVLSILLAATVPHSAGPNSWTTPFVCKLWSQGRNNIQLGMITSLEVRRHIGNIGMNAYGQSTGVDISFTVSNLNKMLHIPITNEFRLSHAIGMGAFDEETNFTDYMATLGGLHVHEMHYLAPKWRLKWLRDIQDIKSALTVPNFTQKLLHGNFLPGNVIAAFGSYADL